MINILFVLSELYFFPIIALPFPSYSCCMLWNVLSALSLLRVDLIDVLTVIITDIVSCYSYTAVNNVLSLFIGPGNTTG